MDHQNPSTSDHDLLIQISVTQTAMREEMRQSNTQSSQQLSDHEARIRILEKNDDISRGTKQGISNTGRWMIGSLGVIAAFVEPALMLYLAFRK